MPDHLSANFEIPERMPTAEWDSIVHSQSELAGFGQSSAWARIQSKFNNRKPLVLSGCIDTMPDNKFYVQGFISSVNRGSGIRSLLQNMHILAGTSLDIVDGPIIHSENNAAQAQLFSDYLDALEEVCRQQKIDRVKCSGFNHTNPLKDSEAFHAILVEKGFTVSKWATYLLDLSADLDKIFSKLDHHVRARIRKAEENHITISQINSESEFRENFIGVFNRLQLMNKRPERPDTSFMGLWEEREPLLYHPVIARAEDGEIIGVLGSYNTNGVTTEVTSALHPRCYSEKLPAQDLLHWHQIKLANEDGSRYFDFAGVNPNPTNSKEAGIKNFKSKWGGEYVEFLRYEKCFNQTDKTLRRVFKKFLREPLD